MSYFNSELEIGRQIRRRPDVSLATTANTSLRLASLIRLVLVSTALLIASALVAASVARSSDGQVSADQVSADIAVEMQSIISAQIDAFRSQDAETAYSFAAPSIKAMYPTASGFIAMVQRGYPTVYAPQSYRFADAGLTPSGPAQAVEFVADNGQLWGGLYTFAQMEDGTLAISGVYLRQQDAQQI